MNKYFLKWRKDRLKNYSMIDYVKSLEDSINNLDGINEYSLTSEFTDKNGDVFDVTITYSRRVQKTEAAGF